MVEVEEEEPAEGEDVGGREGGVLDPCIEVVLVRVSISEKEDIDTVGGREGGREGGRVETSKEETQQRRQVVK